MVNVPAKQIKENMKIYANRENGYLAKVILQKMGGCIRQHV